MQFRGKTGGKAISKHFRLFWILSSAAAWMMNCCFSLPAVADDDVLVRETVQKLAERVADIPGLHGPLRLEWHPDANWSEGEGGHWRGIVRAELEKRALTLTEDAGAPALDVFAAETPTQVVLTAKTRVADRDEVRIVSVGRALLSPVSPPIAPVRLERQMIYENENRILDALSVGSGAEGGLALLLYKNFEIVAFRLDSKGAVRDAVSLSAANLKPSRDPHAELSVRAGLNSVQVPGKVCEFSWEAPAEVKCHGERPASAAKSEWRGEMLLASPCDGSSWKLVKSGSEPNAREVLQVVPEGALLETSAAVLSEFPGPIVGTNRERNPDSALVIARDLRTGNYEIYKITLACGN